MFELFELPPEMAKGHLIWLSPDGKIFALGFPLGEVLDEVLDEDNEVFLFVIGEGFTLDDIAKEICDSLLSVEASLSSHYLLDQGWMCYHNGGKDHSWIWWGKKMNSIQLSVAKKIDYNESLQLLERWKMV